MITVAELAKRLGAQLEHSGNSGAETITAGNDGSKTITALSTLTGATSSSVSFLSSTKFLVEANKSKAAALVVGKNLGSQISEYSGHKLIVTDAYRAFAKLSEIFSDKPAPSQSVHSTAVVHQTARIGKEVSIGAFCVIEADADIGDNAVIGASSFIGAGCRIGPATVIDANVTIHHKVVIGAHGYIQSGTVIGSEGFGYAPVPHKSDDGSTELRWDKIHQVGSVVIGDHVEIGANSCIDRGAIEDTVVSDHCIIDNHVHVAHNVHLGRGTAIAGGSGIAGSTKIGKACLIGGSGQISGHLTIGDNVELKGGTIVLTDLEAGKTYGNAPPTLEERSWRRYFVRLKELNSLFSRVKKLEKSIRQGSDAK